VAEALRNNPEILAAQKRYEAARLRPRQESSLPDPVLSLGYASSGSPRPFAGLGEEPTSNAGVTLAQEFPFPGKRRLRGEIAGKEAEAELQDYRAVQLSVVSRLKQAFHRLRHTYDLIDVLRQNQDLLRAILGVAEARYTVGKAPQQDLFNIQAQLSMLETRILRMEQDKRSAEAEINSLVTRPPGSPLGRPENADPEPLPVTLEDLFAAARENSPELLRGEKTIQKSELALSLARKDYYPDSTLSAGYFNMGRMADMYQFRIDFKLPPWSLRKRRDQVAEQAAGVSRARHDLEAAGLDVRYRIQNDYLAAGTSQQLMRMYRDTVIPQAELAVESSLASYETGAVDLLNVLANLTARFEYEENYHEEFMSYQLALARLEQLTGKQWIP
jgi:outer membrane protein TolC